MKAIDKKFYNLFWTDPTCQKIFSAHKSQLLEGEVELIVTKEKFYAQRLVLTNSLKRKTGLQIAKRNENENIELLHELRVAVQKYLDPQKLEIYAKSKFGKTIKKIQTDLSKKDGWIKLITKFLLSLENEKDLFKLLSDYHLIPSDIEDKLQFEKYLLEELRAHTKTFFNQENLSDLAISIDLVSTYYNHKIKNNLVVSTKHYTDVLYDAENFHDRSDFFDNLFEIGLIKGGKLKGYYECVNCAPNTFNGILTTNLKPSNLKLKCPCCKRELLYIIPYELNKCIYDDIVHPDGLLFFAIKHLLEEYNYPFVANKHEGTDIELDFCLLNKDEYISELVEVKMYKTDRPLDTQISNIKDAISQTKKMADKLVKIQPLSKGLPISIVSNITNESVYKTVKKELVSDLKKYNIGIYSIEDFYARIKR